MGTSCYLVTASVHLFKYLAEILSLRSKLLNIVLPLSFSIFNQTFIASPIAPKLSLSLVTMSSSAESPPEYNAERNAAPAYDEPDDGVPSYDNEDYSYENPNHVGEEDVANQETAEPLINEEETDEPDDGTDDATDSGWKNTRAWLNEMDDDTYHEVNAGYFRRD